MSNVIAFRTNVKRRKRKYMNYNDMEFAQDLKLIDNHRKLRMYMFFASMFSLTAVLFYATYNYGAVKFF
jgi:hypothetical protein